MQQSITPSGFKGPPDDEARPEIIRPHTLNLFQSQYVFVSYSHVVPCEPCVQLRAVNASQCMLTFASALFLGSAVYGVSIHV